MFLFVLPMKLLLTTITILLSGFLCAQDATQWKKTSVLFVPELLLGKTAESNDGFPERDLQKQIVLNIGRDHERNPQEWAQRLKGVRTGIGLGYTDFGNLDSLGIALTVIPYIEFPIFGSKRFTTLVGMGGSYFTEKYDAIENPNNNAVTTDITWAYRTYLYYRLASFKSIDWRVGLGYSHHSNGHTRLLNQGYNSFLLSVSAAILNPLQQTASEKDTIPSNYDRSIHSYVDFRSAIGQNVFALAFNDKKEVYGVSTEYGHVFNNTFRLGIGLYYRFYEHYYDYIQGNESLVQEGREFESYKDAPVWNSSTIGAFIHGEFLLNHIGLDLQLGYNFHKPAYRIEWRINEGWDNTPRDIPEFWELGEFGSKFKLKHRISSRLGLKYYVIGTSKSPKHNVYFGAHINSNLGQADFTELAVGYVYSFRFKKRN
ncbi:acyloxyacyl hydrolase [Altibacter sp.]|uniref:acyloxyacyl hydrolase n=1 Tax=Altibacter sp. TaxID=2024823 RepID=UPI00258FCE62|nr:acyloxyacyl hydrolase [Altibacter sp.]MCW9036407.1 acyloxyacyl hydrolase [Altibacter sp.]